MLRRRRLKFTRSDHSWTRAVRKAICGTTVCRNNFSMDLLTGLRGVDA
jgi:hypothetical protein